MRQTIDRTMLTEGIDVYASDGQHVGKIDEVGEDYVLVQKGTFFPRDVYVPVIAIDRVEDGAVWINVARDDIDARGWDGPPATDRDTTRIPLHEEQLEARKTPRQAGEVRVRKDVLEQEQTMDVPVTREEVRVNRRKVDRPATDAEASFAEGSDSIRVPVMEEDVEVTKRPRVTEEVEIQKVARQDTERVGGTVRREQVEVSGEDSKLR